MARKLNSVHKKYIFHRTRGLSRRQSAILAGANIDKDGKVQMEDKNETVKDEIARIRAETAANTGVTKEQVVEMLLKAFNDASQCSNQNAMVAAAREIGKMLGHYAPEVKKNIHELDITEAKKLIDSMPDSELFKLAKGKVIDGKSTRVTNLPQLPSPEDK